MKIEQEYTAMQHKTKYIFGDKELVAMSRTTPETADSHPVLFPIDSLEDVKLMTEFFNNASFEVELEAVKKHHDFVESNQDKLFLHSMSATPVMELIQYLMTVENFIYMLYDYEEEMEQLMQSMQCYGCKKLELQLQNSPVDYFLSVENTSTTLINPNMFDKYCKNHLIDQNKLIKQYGKKQILHMCGKLFKILPMINEIDVVAMEAFSSHTVGDTNIVDGYTYLPEKVIIGGSCASTWILPPDEIAKRIISDIEEAGSVKKLFLSSGGVIPFEASPEIIKEVFDKIKDHIN